MKFDSYPNAQRERRYPFLSAFDSTLNLMLSCSVFALGCAVLGIILTNNGSYFGARLALIAAHIFS
ncbi:hypothetical protein B1R32_10121 [Abditibacterium utsteinense]|uniref:Uncharacterized protein n=1 Tax=Abditibacterium utsteinense TaxID=1960156 RepID=A0A2S8SWV9_9BACT|nr:hypothetical protein [Abditibacterium utsteinense]PQV65283.1 hypothetical protein B1R32_10121 [Abditibacterium utsteinense]